MSRPTQMIFRRELAAYFNSALALIIIPVFLALVAGFSLWFEDLLTADFLSLRPVYFWISISYLLLVPAVTMHLFAEEQRTGSIELLMTLPVTEEQMVWGKYLAALTLMSVGLLLTLSYPITLSLLGDMDWGPVIGGYFGLFLLGAALSAIGVAASALTKNQIIAFLLALLASIVPFATGFALPKVPPSLLPLVQFLSFESHFANLSKGIIDSRTVIFYLSVVLLFLQISIFVLRRRRLS